MFTKSLLIVSMIITGDFGQNASTGSKFIIYLVKTNISTMIQGDKQPMVSKTCPNYVLFDSLMKIISKL